MSTSAFATETNTYSYDALGRLVLVAHAGTTNDGAQSAFAYDPADNRTSVTASGWVNALSVADASVTEGGNLAFVVTRTGPAQGVVTVNYATSDGSATAGARYVPTSGTLTFSATDRTQTILVPTVDDVAVQGNQTLNVALSSPSAGMTITRGAAVGTIVDNDLTPVSFSIGNAPTVTEGGALVYTVTKSTAVPITLSVNYATADGSGAAGADYVPTSGTLTFSPSEMSKTISVGTVDDATPEPAKTVLVNLSGATSGATVAVSQASGTVNDNDTTPISFAVSNADPVIEGGTLVFTVTRSGATYLSTSVNYSTADGSATAGSDYGPTSGTLTFGPSETSKTVGVATFADLIQEPGETVLLNLSGANGGGISVGQGSGTIDDTPLPPIAAKNPALHFGSQTSNGIAIATLVTFNGRQGRIVSFTPSAGGGSAGIAADGQSVVYTSPVVAQPGLCEPAVTVGYSASFAVQDNSNGAITSGTANIAVTGPAGARPRPPQQCP